jgi:hypothetical protein
MFVAADQIHDLSRSRFYVRKHTNGVKGGFFAFGHVVRALQHLYVIAKRGILAR